MTNGNGGKGDGLVMASGPEGRPGRGYAQSPPPVDLGPSEREGLTLSDYGAVLFRRWWIIVVVVVVATASAYFFAARQPKQYSTSATIIYKQQLDLANPLNSGWTDVAGIDREVASINSLLSSPELQESAESLLKESGVDQAAGYAVTAGQEEGESDSATNVVTFTGDSTSPKLAAAGANAAAKSFVDWNRELQRAQIGRGIDVLESQLGAYRTTTSKQTTDYLLLKQRLQDLQILEASATGDYRILSPAVVPTVPYAPDPMRSAILGFGIGLFAGIGLVFLLEMFDTRLRRPDEVATLLRQPILGRIPRISSRLLGDSALVTMRHPEGHIAEAFRMVRTNLDFMAVDNEVKSLLVTSCLQGEGKSVAVANLAISMALAGKKVVVVDGDMRRPRQHKLFDVDNANGLSTVATGRCGLMPAMKRVNVAPVQDGEAGAKAVADGADFAAWAHATDALSTLYVLPSGPIPPNPGEIVSSKRFQGVLDALVAEADLVIVDTPAMLAVGDTSAIAAKVDGVVFLVDLKRAKKPQLYTAADQLYRLPTKMLGAVVRMHRTRSSRYYYYSPYYYYRYSYAEDGSETKDRRRHQGEPKATDGAQV